jgi:hypothetical protein
MNLVITSLRQRVESESYSLFFPLVEHPGAGWAPPCDKDGNVLPDEFASLAQRQAEVAKHLADPIYGKPYVQTFYNSYVEAAVGRCECGGTVQLDDGLENFCDECGACYNMAGQRVHPELAEGNDLY